VNTSQPNSRKTSKDRLRPRKREDVPSEKPPSGQRAFESWLTRYLRKLDEASKGAQRD